MSPSAIRGLSPASIECRVTASTKSDQGSTAKATTAVTVPSYGKPRIASAITAAPAIRRPDRGEPDDRLARLERGPGGAEVTPHRPGLLIHTQAAAMPTESIATSIGDPWRPSMNVWWISSLTA